MGHSAGAHMAALLALDRDYLVRAGVRPDCIVGLVGLSGPYALEPNTTALRSIFSPPFTPGDWQPVRFASERSPATLLLQGLDDRVVNPDHARKLREALERRGVAVETLFYPGRGHGDTIASFSGIGRHRTPALAQTVVFLERVTRGRSADVTSLGSGLKH